MKEKWISVEDRYPKNGERVLVICTNPQNHHQRHISICDHYVINDRRYRNAPLHKWSGGKEVTHWMPLPEMIEE